MHSAEALRAGARELAAILVPAGFEFYEGESGASSGGDFASGEYRRGDRRLELHVRSSLGMVTYHVAEKSLGHEDYVRAIRAVDGIESGNCFPSFGEELPGQFRALGEDLRVFGNPFLCGTEGHFEHLRSWVVAHPRARGFAAF
jgi:hypothetical protein